jgi:hypothetical protein
MPLAIIRCLLDGLNSRKARTVTSFSRVGSTNPSRRVQRDVRLSVAPIAFRSVSVIGANHCERRRRGSSSADLRQSHKTQLSCNVLD